MIFRKPYGFLIKNFKIIHLILTGIYIYLAIKVGNLLNYYNGFINGTEGKLTAITHMTNYYIIAIISSIVICIVIFALMKYKKKPKLLYVILIVLYIIVAVIINMSYEGLYTIYMSTLEAKTQRLYRDLLQIILVIQYISIAFTLVRGLGFDIKKFNFKEDISELELDITDDEEVELTLGSTEGTQRKIRRYLRELKYYYKENKLFINIIIVVVILILASTITIEKEVVNKVYKEQEVVTTEDFTFKILDSYITNKNYENKTITNTETSFVIVKVLISSNSGSKALNTANLILTTNNNSYTMSNRYYSNFIDIGIGYKNQKIAQNKQYIFVFNISNEDIKNKMQLIYLGDKKIEIKPETLDSITDTKTQKLNSTINLAETPLGSGGLTITSYEVNQKFAYEYTYEINGQSYTGKLNVLSLNNTILKLEMNAEVPSSFTTFSLIKNYGSIKYKVGETEYTSKVLNNKTPGSYTSGLYLEVDKNIENAESIWLDLTIRNKEYIYTIK